MNLIMWFIAIIGIVLVSIGIGKAYRYISNKDILGDTDSVIKERLKEISGA